MWRHVVDKDKEIRKYLVQTLTEAKGRRPQLARIRTATVSFSMRALRNLSRATSSRLG